MSLLLARGSQPITVVSGIGLCEGAATVLGIGVNSAAVGGTRQMVRAIYEIDPPNRFWPDPSIHTY